ncbi:hypothetical protein HD806DRAFT_62510 [Xylariaceae sp. AK1471]|nr:hypothetical protein HD806DRAFT_62510 [Xylariaceae sp. AK1471]
MASSGSSSSSRRRHTYYSRDDGEDNLRSKRSSITIECSDGSKVIFVRPHRRRSGSNSASQSGSSSPAPPLEPGPENGGGGSQRPTHSGSMYAQSNTQGCDICIDHNLRSGTNSSSSGHHTTSPLPPDRRSQVDSNRHAPDQPYNAYPAPPEASPMTPVLNGEADMSSGVHSPVVEEQPTHLSAPNWRMSGGMMRPTSAVHGESRRDTPGPRRRENEDPSSNGCQHPSPQPPMRNGATATPLYTTPSSNVAFSSNLYPPGIDPRQSFPIYMIATIRDDRESDGAGGMSPLDMRPRTQGRAERLQDELGRPPNDHRQSSSQQSQVRRSGRRSPNRRRGKEGADEGHHRNGSDEALRDSRRWFPFLSWFQRNHRDDNARGGRSQSRSHNQPRRGR